MQPAAIVAEIDAIKAALGQHQVFAALFRHGGSPKAMAEDEKNTADRIDRTIENARDHVEDVHEQLYRHYAARPQGPAGQAGGGRSTGH